jgi:hypothetical protein
LNQKIERGPGFWKLNSHLLSLNNTRQDIENIWKEAISSLTLETNVHLWWNNLTKIISFYFKEKGHEHAQEVSENLNNLKKELQYWSTQMMTFKHDHIYSKIEEIQLKINKINEVKANGAKIRSKIFGITQSEKPTKFFFHKAQTRKVKCIIHELRSSNGTIATGFALLEVARRYYKKLYGNKQTNSKSQSKLLKAITSLLKKDSRHKLEQSLQMEELAHAVNKMKKSKSPGSAGLTAELYQEFPFLLKGLLNMWKFSLKQGILPKETRKGIISLIHKKNEKNNIGNYRPITLLNMDYKIIAAAYANRLKEVIGSLVGHNQRGFIPGRDIRVSIMEAKLTLKIGQRLGINGAIILWDWEKAFDRVDRKWLFKIMHKMDFGSNFIQAIQILHKGSVASIEINGFLTEEFNINSGVRQGCPIAPFLFAITTEPLRAIIVLDRSFTGIIINEVKLTLSLFADDTSGYIANLTDYNIITDYLKMYSQASGALLNNDKTSAILIGKDFGLANIIHCIAPNEVERLLGASIGFGNCKLKDLQTISAKIDQKVSKWKSIPLTQFGRSLVANSSILSHVWFTAQVNHLEEKDIKQIERKTWNFIDGTGDKRCRMNYKDAVKPKR